MEVGLGEHDGRAMGGRNRPVVPAEAEVNQAKTGGQSMGGWRHGGRAGGRWD